MVTKLTITMTISTGYARGDKCIAPPGELGLNDNLICTLQ